MPNRKNAQTFFSRINKYSLLKLIELRDEISVRQHDSLRGTSRSARIYDRGKVIPLAFVNLFIDNTRTVLSILMTKRNDFREFKKPHIKRIGKFIFRWCYGVE